MQTFSRTPPIGGRAGGPARGLARGLGRALAALAGVLARGPHTVAARVFDTMQTWQERAAQRHALRGLDARGLADIGLTRADVELEASKPFWQP